MYPNSQLVECEHVQEKERGNSIVLKAPFNVQTVNINSLFAILIVLKTWIFFHHVI
jgi:hypothetical protein